jgi:hypothetical protein
MDRVKDCKETLLQCTCDLACLKVKSHAALEVSNLGKSHMHGSMFEELAHHILMHVLLCPLIPPFYS